jgi:DNA repair ATPase RecN
MRTRAILLVFACLLHSACQSTYYGAMEKIGFQKREILTSRVEKARDSQQEAGEQFRSTLDRFREVVNVEGGELEAKYETLSATFERSEARAEEVRKRIDAVEEVAGALFEEWEAELKQYRDKRLQAESRRTLTETRRLYRDLMRTMRQVESRMGPVLAAFNDQVLLLKHNLNARAVASLRPELGRIEADVERLIREMEAAIREADVFIRRLEAA